MLDETTKILVALNMIAMGCTKKCDVCFAVAKDIQGILLREDKAKKEQEKQEDEEWENRDSWRDDDDPHCPECGEGWSGTL